MNPTTLHGLPTLAPCAGAVARASSFMPLSQYLTSPGISGGASPQ